MNEEKTKKLWQLAKTINKSGDLLPLLDDMLAEIVELAALEAGWILLQDEVAGNPEPGDRFFLAAQCNLPPGIDADIWNGPCACQDHCKSEQMVAGGFRVTCERFDQPGSSWPELLNHSTIPICSNDSVLGSLNFIAPNGVSVEQGILTMLNLVTSHLGTALDRQRLAKLVQEKLDQEQAMLLALTNKLLSLSTLEDVLDHLVKEVIRLLQVDACALLLPDEESDYLLFRASAGWHSDPVAQRRRIPGNHRSSSGQAMRDLTPALFRSHADLNNVPEVTIDWLDEEKFESMVIVPLVVDGKSIGALAATNRTPREFGQDEIGFLKILANQAGIAVENSRLQKEEIQLKRLEEELAIGRRIQRSLLPAVSPSMPGWQFSDIYRPARHVGGDLYDYFELPYGGTQLGIVIGDVADKGVPAALFMATSRTLIRSTALAGLTAASTLVEANRLIQQDSPSELFLSAFYGILNVDNGKLRYASAGHNPPLWLEQESGGITELQARGTVLCVLDELSLEERSVDIGHGDVLVFYTDGVTEAMNANYEEFGLDRVKRVMKANAQESADQILKAIVEAIDAFSGSVEHADDLTLVVAKRL